MNRYNEETDLTTRDIILVGCMLFIMLLAVIGLLNTFSDFAENDFWNMFSGGELWDKFCSLLNNMLC